MGKVNKSNELSNSIALDIRKSNAIQVESEMCQQQSGTIDNYVWQMYEKKTVVIS